MQEEATRAASAATVSLIQYGAIGALLVIFLGVFLWLFYRLINKMLGEWSEQWRAISGFMGEQIKAMQALRETIQTQQKEILAEFRDLHRPTHPSMQTHQPSRQG